MKLTVSATKGKQGAPLFPLASNIPALLQKANANIYARSYTRTPRAKRLPAHFKSSRRALPANTTTRSPSRERHFSTKSPSRQNHFLMFSAPMYHSSRHACIEVLGTNVSKLSTLVYHRVSTSTYQSSRRAAGSSLPRPPSPLPPRPPCFRAAPPAFEGEPEAQRKDVLALPLSCVVSIRVAGVIAWFAPCLRPPPWPDLGEPFFFSSGTRGSKSTKEPPRRTRRSGVPPLTHSHAFPSMSWI